jgi:hypothetical protein
MKLEDALENYQYYSGKASDLCRQLAFAGIALVWIFKTGESIHASVPKELRPATLFMVITLSLDFLQYVVGSATWGIYNRQKERAGIKNDQEFRAPPWINYATLALYWTKLGILACGYAYILKFLFGLVFGS